MGGDHLRWVSLAVFVYWVLYICGQSYIVLYRPLFLV